MDTTPIKSIKELEFEANPIVDMIIEDEQLNSAEVQHRPDIPIQTPSSSLPNLSMSGVITSTPPSAENENNVNGHPDKDTIMTLEYEHERSNIYPDRKEFQHVDN